MELSTAVRYDLNPIVIVLNNRGYGTERQMQDGPYNDVTAWQYHRLPEIFGAGRAFLVNTEKQLDEALMSAKYHTEAFSLIEVRLDQNDRSPALQRLAKRLGDNLRGGRKA
jgi:TPP-dependent 2-oxoacid decarboxylase